MLFIKMTKKTKTARAPKMELTHLTVFLEGRKTEKIQFGRDASNGLATFTVCELYAAKSTSSLICKIQYKIHILEVNVQKLNVF